MAIRHDIIIPVQLGGYTGQRDAWEEHTYDAKVEVTDGEVRLALQGHDGRVVQFDAQDIFDALARLGCH